MMKKILIVPILVLSFGLFSCTKESVKEQTVFLQADKEAIFNPGGFVFGTCDHWGITNFIQGGMDFTKNYRSLDLRFCPDNTVTVSNDLFSVTGNWYFLMDKGDMYILRIQFNAPERNVLNEYMPGFWAEIADNWKVIRMGRNLLNLQSVNKSKRMSLGRANEGAVE